jgi:hypothetical protein
MRFASILLHSQDLITDANPLGATAIFREGGAAAVVEAVRPMIGKVDGILLQRFHCALDEPVVVGVRPDQMEVETYLGGPEDRQLSEKEIEIWAALGRETRLAIYTTMPRSIAGFDALDRLAAIEPWGTFFDVAGQNESLLAQRAVIHADRFRRSATGDSVGGVPEPTPMPELTPRWMPRDQYTAGMAERWRTLRRRRAMPSSGMVMYNGNRGGKSFWNAGEAPEWEEMGLDVSAPAARLFPDLPIDD